jgi:hypothetical protein
MADDPEYEKGLQKAYRLLAVRARSERELRTRLKEKMFDGQVIDRVIARLYELNYLDDEAFARQWARRLAVDKLSGNRRIELSLLEKGVDRTTGPCGNPAGCPGAAGDPAGHTEKIKRGQASETGWPGKAQSGAVSAGQGVYTGFDI